MKPEEIPTKELCDALDEIAGWFERRAAHSGTIEAQVSWGNMDYCVEASRRLCQPHQAAQGEPRQVNLDYAKGFSLGQKHSLECCAQLAIAEAQLAQTREALDLVKKRVATLEWDLRAIANYVDPNSPVHATAASHLSALTPPEGKP